MKNVFFGFLVLAAIPAVSASEDPGVGRDVPHQRFMAVYKDTKNGLEWSKALNGFYKNGCIDSDGEYDLSACTNDQVAPGDIRVRIQDSAAAKACAHVGGRLPTQKEFYSLISNFDFKEMDQGKGPRLTSTGRAEMQAVFGDMAKFLWSSSIVSGTSDTTWVFSGGGGDVHFDYRSSTYGVRCVSP